uniref:Putative tigger transposase n=1 Tax=Ixodes ricinus TaxID=34613 RepID=A0A147BRW9_IXORI
MATTMRLAFPAFLRCCTNVGCTLALSLIILCCTLSKAEAQFSFLFCQLSFSQYSMRALQTWHRQAKRRGFYHSKIQYASWPKLQVDRKLPSWKS